ncbi:MAG: Asp23/Gls24 family envelope stress response protein [Cellulosilyticum sp.]|nr:Asp23/Gls24 family envelope stress response protein [Cellulosilyticum sp.]MEE1072611.1 Asp23/Gls24 family envelope stress response protein [Cellulosilyticum sp.]
MDEQNVIGLEITEEVDQVQIADDVIAVVAEIAALEVEGIIGTAAEKGDFRQALSGKKRPKGVKVEVGEGEVFIDLGVIVKYGAKVQKICREAQEKVKNSVETMTGLNVISVNMHVVGVHFDKEQEA